MPDPTALLTIDGSRSGYGGKPVVQGVDLSVRDRGVTAVIGRNGVGKSTLMKAVIGLLPTVSRSISSRSFRADLSRSVRLRCS
jgi:ABC-type branched-subunit amino acid transport system ATPase component